MSIVKLPNMIKKIHKSILIFSAFILLMVIMLSTISFSKYYIDQKSDPLVANVQDFYFESDVLGTVAEDKDYTISNYLEGETITFSLRNYDDSLRKSKENIHYDITTSIVSSTGSKTEVTDIVTARSPIIEDGSYVLNSTHDEDAFDIEVPLHYFENRTVVVEVKAVSTSPFASELYATFTFFQPFDDAFLKVTDEVGNDTLILNVSTYELAGSLTIDYPNNIYPDRTNMYIGEGVDGNKEITIGSGSTLSSMIVNINTFSSYDIIFFKDDSSRVYTVDDFIKR